MQSDVGESWMRASWLMHREVFLTAMYFPEWMVSNNVCLTVPTYS